MDILNQVDLNFLITMGFVFPLVVVLYLIASARQRKALMKVDASLKLQEQANQQLNSMVTELRRSNRFLSILAEMEPQEYSETAITTSSSAYSMGTNEGGQYKLYVGNIDYSATESELADHFARYGQVQFVNIPINRYTGRARGFGFITFSSKEEAERAITLHGTEFKGRQIQVNFAKERELAQ